MKTPQIMDPSWKPPGPCRIGDDISQIYTPALLVDVDKLKENMKKMTESMKRFDHVAVRPHGKAHKCPEIAKLQV